MFMPPAPQRSPLLLFLLKYPLFILIALGIAGYAAWRWTREPGPPSLPVFSEPTEAHRPALKAALASALKKFFATPDDAHRLDAIEAIRDYRRSFPDATQHDLMDPAEAVTCNVQLECDQREQEHKKKIAALEATIASQFAHLPKDSPEQLAAITEAYALDRRFPLRTITTMIERHQEGIQHEAQLMKLQADFFRIIDETAVAENYQTVGKNGQLIQQYLSKYIELSQRSLKHVPTRCQGPDYPGGFISKDPAACKAAMAEYDAFERRETKELDAQWKAFPDAKAPEHRPFTQRMLLARAGALKKLLGDRAATQEYMWRKTTHLLQ